MGLIINALRHPVLIRYLAGANNYSFVHFRNGEQLMISKSLRFLEKQLPDFVRLHKTTLVNPDCITEVQQPPHARTGGNVVLEDGTVIPVSRRQWSLLRQKLLVDKPVSVPFEQTVVFVSSDTAKGLLLRQFVADQWPQTLLHVTESPTALLDLLSLAEARQPALLFIDLRQATTSRLTLLRKIKEAPLLHYLPVVLLLTPDVDTTKSGYTLRANSVVVISADNDRFMQVMEHVCRYWLSVASLPLA